MPVAGTSERERNVQNHSNFFQTNWPTTKCREREREEERERESEEEWAKLIKMLFSLLFTQQIASNAHKSNCSHRSSKDAADAILGTTTVNSILPAYFMGVFKARLFVYPSLCFPLSFPASLSLSLEWRHLKGSPGASPTGPAKQIKKAREKTCSEGVCV